MSGVAWLISASGLMVWLVMASMARSKTEMSLVAFVGFGVGNTFRRVPLRGFSSRASLL